MLVDFDRYYELRYEDLTRDPIGQMGALYDHLGLGGFEQLLPRLQEYLAGVKNYEKNRYQLADEQRAKITERWGHVIRNYGYELQPQQPARSAPPLEPTEQPAPTSTEPRTVH
jgi:hypothetical protein